MTAIISVLCSLSVALGVASAMIRKRSIALMVAIASPIVLCFVLAKMETTPNALGTRNGWDVVLMMLGAVFAVPASGAGFAITRWLRRRRRGNVGNPRNAVRPNTRWGGP